MKRPRHWLAGECGSRTPRLALLLLTSLALAPGSLAQEQPGPWRPELQRLDAYSRGIALAVVAGERRVLSAAGGEIFALRKDAEREIALDRDAGPYTWNTAGVVLDLVELDGALYAAAFRDGLRVFDNAVPGEPTAHFSIPLGHEAVSVAALDLGGARLVALGTQTNGPGSGGAVHLLLHAGAELHQLAYFDVGSPVSCLETEPVGENALALFLGTECGTLNGSPAALQRWVFDWDDRGTGMLSRRSAQGWGPGAGDRPPRGGVVRDLLLEPGGERLFVAAFRDGVWALDRETLSPVDEAGWPLKLANESPAPWACDCEAATEVTAAAFHALALAEFEGGRHLLVASGPARTDVSNIQLLSGQTGRSPACGAGRQAELHACPAEARTYGLLAFELLAQGVEQAPVCFLGKSGSRGGVPLIAFDLDTAPAPDGYGVYAALTGFGMHAFHARREGLGWDLRHAASWGAEGPAHLPGPAFDDLVWVDAEPPVLLAATEGGLAAFPVTDARPLSGPFEARRHNPTAPVWRKAGGVTLGAFPGAGGRVIASTGAGGRARPGGLRFYDTTLPARPVLAGESQLQKVGKGLYLEALSWTDPEDATERRRLYSVQLVAGAGPSVLAWDLGTAEEPLDPRLPTDSAPPTPFNMGVPCVGEVRPDPAWGLLLGGVVALPDSDRRVVYVLAGSEPRDPREPQRAVGELGLLVLEERGAGMEAHFGLLSELEATGGREGFLPLEHAGCEHAHEPVRLRYDSRSRRLFGTWVGHLAVWSVREPGHPQLIASRELAGEPAHHGLTLTPTDMRGGATVAGREYAVIAWLNDGLGVLDVTDAASIQSAPLHNLELPWQTTCLLADPRDPSHKTWFAGQGTAGLIHLRLGQRD